MFLSPIRNFIAVAPSLCGMHRGRAFGKIIHGYRRYGNAGLAGMIAVLQDHQFTLVGVGQFVGDYLRHYEHP